MPRGMNNTQFRDAQHQLIPILQIFMGILYLRLFMDVDGRARATRDLPMSRDVIGMVVSLDNCLYPHSFCSGQFQNVVYHVQPRVNHGTDPFIQTANHIAGTAQIFFDQLLEVHRCPLLHSFLNALSEGR